MTIGFWSWFTRHGRRLFVAAISLAALLSPAAVVWAVRDLVRQRGQTPVVIAARHDVTPSELARANQIVNPNLIYAGQVLTIPGAAATVMVDAPADVGAEVVVQHCGIGRFSYGREPRHGPGRV